MEKSVPSFFRKKKYKKELKKSIDKAVKEE